MTRCSPLIAAGLFFLAARGEALANPASEAVQALEGKAVYLVATCGERRLVLSRAGAHAARFTPIGGDPGALRAGALWRFDVVNGGVALRPYLGGGHLSLQRSGAPQIVDHAPKAFAVEFDAQRNAKLSKDGASLRVPGESSSCTFALDPFAVFAPYTRTLHVQQGAEGEADGSPERPFATISAALRRAGPGVRVLVGPGVYRENVDVRPGEGGEADAWLVIESAVPQGARIEGTAGREGLSAVQLDGDYIELHGFEVVNAHVESCVGSEGAHLRIIENFLHDCGGGGVSLSRAHGWHVEGNVVARNAFKNRWQMSGISLYQARGNPEDCAGEFCNIVRRNIAYGNDNHVKDWENRGPTDGNGVIIDDLANTQHGSGAGPYRGWTLVEHNLAFDNGGSGVRVFFSDQVIVRHNTSFANMQRDDGGTWRGEIYHAFGVKTHFERNVAVADLGADRRNVALFDSGNHHAARRWKSIPTWSENLAAAVPERDAARYRRANGPPAETPFLERPPLFADGRTAEALLAAAPSARETAFGLDRHTPGAPGVDPALLPRLR